MTPRVPNPAYLDAELGALAPAFKAQHPGGPEQWRALVQQTAGMWLDYGGLGPEALATVDVPVLVLAGDRDELIPLELSVTLQRALPNAELAVAPFLGHGGPSLKRAEVRTALIATSPGATPAADQPANEEREPTMLANTNAYSGIAVTDLAEAREFYAGTLGLRTSEEYGLLWLQLAGGRDTLIYEQPEVVAASYTVRNFEVDAVDAAVEELHRRGMTFERFDGLAQDEHGVFREEGPYIAWFKDPSRNVLSVLEERASS